MNIQWSASNVGDVSIELARASDNALVEVIADPAPGSSSHSWEVGTDENGEYQAAIPGGSYVIKMYETGTGSGLDYSAPFTISTPALAVQAPNGGESYAIGNTLPITWNASNFCGNVSIELVNSSNTTILAIADPTNNDGAHNWPISGISPGNYKIKIYKTVASGPSPAVDYSNSTFSITNPVPAITITNPSGGVYDKGCTMNIQWSASNVGDVSIELARASNNSLVAVIADPAPGSSSHSWEVGTNENGEYPANITGGSYVIKMYETGTGGGVDYSPPFTIPTPALAVQAPNGGESYAIGSTLPISWNSSDFCGNVSIELANASNTTILAIADPTNNDGAHNWPISGISPGNYKIKIYKTVASGPSPVVDYSNSTFSITGGAPFLQLDQAMSITPASPVTNQDAMMEAVVVNNGNASWTGSLAFQLINLSDGTSTDMITPVFVALAPGEVQALVRPNGPVTSPAGNYQIRVQYQTNGTSTWTNVDPGSFQNPLPFTIQATSSPMLQLNAPISITNPLVQGSPAVFSAEVLSSGGSWQGNLAMHIVVSGVETDLDRDDNITINNGSVYTGLSHSTPAIMTAPGTYNVYVVAQTNGAGAWFPVDAGGYQNPVAVTINPASGALDVTSPDGGESFEVGQNLPISWTSTGNISNISIEMESYPLDPDDKFVIADGIPNASPYNSYIIPLCAVGQYRIKIYETGNGPNTVDYSQASFTIALDPSAYNLALTFPNGGQVFNAGDAYPTITWNATGAVGNVSIELVNGQGAMVDLIADGVPNTGAFTPSPADLFSDYFPGNAPQGEYKVKIYNTGCGTVVDFSDATFTVNSTYTGMCPCTINDPSPAQAEAYAAVSYLCEHCIIDPPAAPGYSVNPIEPIVKEDLAKITFLGLFGNPNTPTYADDFPTPFFDMQQSAPYQRYGKVLSYLEYGDGISPFNRRFSNYKPGSPITRGQVCKVYCEAFNIECNAASEPFLDVEPDHPEFKYIAELVERGLINTSGTHFRPDDAATREEAFILLYRILALCSDCKDNALLATQAESGPAAQAAFFDPGNYTPYNLGRHPGFSDANFDSYSATGFYMADRGMPLVFGHSYNSYLTELPDEFFPHRPLGNGWVHTYHSYIVKVPYNDAIGVGEDILAAVWPDGTIHAYKDDGNVNPEKITKGNYDEIAWHSGGDYYTIKKKNQVTFKYEKINGANDAPYVLTEIKDRNNNVISLAYQVHNYGGKALARLLEVTGTTGRKLRLAYYGNSDKIHFVNDLALGRSIEFYLGNPNNLDTRLLWYKDAENNQSNYNYDDTSEGGYYLLKIITLPNGNFITNNYYDKKLTSSVTNNTATNNTVQTNVNWGLSNGGATGSVSTVSIYDGASARDYTYTVNSLGKTTQIDAPTNDADIVYGDADNPTLPTSITVAGLTTTYAYDMMGNVTDVYQEEGTTHHFDYNSNNDITLYRNPRDKTTTFTYGDGKNLTRADAPIGSTTMTYYPYGLVHTVANPEGITVSYEYDAHGNVDKMTAPEDISSSAVYDMGSRLQEFYNPNNQKTTYDYDGRDFIEQVTNHLPNHPQYQQVATQYAYDGNGNLTEITNALGHVTELEYDYFDLLKRETFGTATRSYEYDVEGKLQKITKADGMELIYSYLQTEGLLESDGYATYGYDSKHRLHTVSKGGKTITFNYDGLNRVTSTVYDGQTVQYVYDLNSNVEQVVYPGGNTVSYTYDDNDRMKTVTDWNGNVTEYFYLLDGRLDEITYPNGVVTQYAYDNAGRMTNMATTKGAATICAYDFTLDKLGNHTLESKTEPFGYSSWPDINETDYSYNSRNEIQSGGGKNFTHDNNGNVETIAGARNLTLAWDKHDMLDSVSEDFNAAYVYDGLGHRRQATRNGTVTKYVLDILGMSRILIERDANDNDQHYYVYGLGLISRVKPNDDTRYYHYDFRGSTVAMTDEAGAITHQYAYDEYGAALQVQEEDFNPFRFVGGFGVMQEDSTLFFMRARYYEASIGRFLSEDPIWSDNLYGYGGNNPNMVVDFNGQFPAMIAVAIGVYAVYKQYKFIYDINKSLKEDNYKKAENLAWRKLKSTKIDAFVALLPVSLVANEGVNELLMTAASEGLDDLSTEFYNNINNISSPEKDIQSYGYAPIVDMGLMGQGNIAPLPSDNDLGIYSDNLYCEFKQPIMTEVRPRKILPIRRTNGIVNWYE